MADAGPTPPPLPQYDPPQPPAPAPPAERPMTKRAKKAAKTPAAPRGRKALDVTPWVKEKEKELPLPSLLMDHDQTKGQIRGLDLGRVGEILAGLRGTEGTMEIKSCTVWEADVLGVYPSLLHAHLRACPHTSPLVRVARTCARPSKVASIQAFGCTPPHPCVCMMSAAMLSCAVLPPPQRDTTTCWASSTSSARCSCCAGSTSRRSSSPPAP